MNCETTQHVKVHTVQRTIDPTKLHPDICIKNWESDGYKLTLRVPYINVEPDGYKKEYVTLVFKKEEIVRDGE